jgi:hypothetical protein
VASRPGPGTALGAEGIPDFSHVVVIVLENQEYGDVIGNANAPYLNSLAASGAVATQYYALQPGSLPNYLALTGGSTAGLADNCNPGPGCQAPGMSIVQEIAAAGKTWKAYLEGMPSPCASSDSGTYMVAHNPFVYYPALASPCSPGIVDASGLTQDIASGSLPSFAWLTPDDCNDMHSCSVATGDTYLAGIVPKILGALGPSGVLFITFDEGTTTANGGGHVATIAVGPAVKAGATSSTFATPYSLLRTIEDGWTLPPLGGSATASPLRDLFP